jgi:hypothetical protein
MRKPHAWLAVSLCALFVIAYAHTSSVSVSWKNFSEDSGDLLTCAYTLGIPHPTGYPAFLLLGRFFSLVMPGGVAFRITLLSILAGALAPVFLFLTMVRVMPSRAGLLAGLAGALSLGFSLHYWSQAVVAEVYSLHMLFLSIVVYLVVRWSEQDGDRYLLMAAYVLGLSFANHMLSVLTLVFGAVLIIRPRSAAGPSLGMSVSCAALFCLALTMYVCLPIRSAKNPELDWGNPETWSQFRWVVTGAQYHFRLLASPLSEGLSRLWPGPFLASGWPALGLAVVGLAPGTKHNRMRAAMLAMAVLDLILVAIYEIPDPPAYFLPASLALSVLAALGIERAAAAAEKALRRGEKSAASVPRGRSMPPWAVTWRGTMVAAALLAACVLPPALGNARQVDASTDLTPYVFGQATFRAVESDALIVSEYDGRTFALWFFRETEFRGTHARSVVVSKYLLVWPWYVQNLRTIHPDLRVPDAGDMDEVMVALVDANLDSRPVYSVEHDPALVPFFDLKPVLGGDVPLFRVQRRAEETP